jgi:hypothetical protein
MAAAVGADDHLVQGSPRGGPGSIEMELWNRWGAWVTPTDGADRPDPLPLPHDDGLDDGLEELPVEPERPWGCGWFDSSLDLREGLAVIEHAGIDLRLAVPAMVMPEPAMQ